MIECKQIQQPTTQQIDEFHHFFNDYGYASYEGEDFSSVLKSRLINLSPFMMKGIYAGLCYSAIILMRQKLLKLPLLAINAVKVMAQLYYPLCAGS